MGFYGLAAAYSGREVASSARKGTASRCANSGGNVVFPALLPPFTTVAASWHPECNTLVFEYAKAG